MTSINRKNPNKSPQGVTLVELMVVLAVLSIVMGLIYSIFISQMQSSIWREELAERKQSLDGAMNLMISEFIKADGVMATNGVCVDNIKIKMKNKNTSSDYDTLWYKRDDTDDSLLMRLFTLYNSATPSTAVVAENITDLQFNCFNQSGELMDPADTENFDVSDIRRITMSLTGKSSRPNPATGLITNSTITGSIRLRNMPTYAGSGCGLLYFSLTPANVAFCNPPGDTATINIRICDLEGFAMNATGENAIKIYPKGGLPVDITGTGITYDEGVAVMEINSPADTGCMDISATSATVSADLTNAANAERLTPGTGVELVAVWKPEGCSYDISTSRSLTVDAGDPYQFVGNAVGIFVDDVSTSVMNACQSEKTAELRASVIDACGNPMSGQTVDFVIAEGQSAQRGYIGPVTEENGTYIATYNAGSLANVAGIEIHALDPAIVNAANVSVNNTIDLHPHTPTSLAKTASSLDDVTLKNCINNQRELSFKVLDACDNNSITDQTSELTATSTDQWTQLHGGGVGNIILNPDDSYSVIYNTSSTHCGPSESAAQIKINHAGIDGYPDLWWGLNLEQCEVPGLNLQVTPTSLVQGCGQASVEVSATVLLDSADPNRNCGPAPAGTMVSVDFELRNVRSSGSPTDWGLSGFGLPNGRFLQPPTMAASNSASTTVNTYSPTPAITNVIAWDAAAGDKLYVRAKAVVPSFTNGSLPDFRIPIGGAWAVYNTPITIQNGADAALELRDSSWVAVAPFYNVPQLVPTAETGFIYAQVLDCDENEDPGVIDHIIVNLESDNASFTNSLTGYELWEVDPTQPGITLDPNTGYFRAAVPMQRVPLANTLHVDKGAHITVDYTDDDDGTDIELSTIDLTGCRELLFVDKDGLVRNIVTPAFTNDSGVYNLVEGPSSFSLIANAPTSAGSGMTNTTIINLPQGTPLTARLCSTDETAKDTTNEVFLIEDGDTGLFIINTTLLSGNHLADFMFVGEDAAIANDPAPGGDSNLGVRVASSPDIIKVVIPATAAPNCDTNNATVVNYGCFAELPVRDADVPVFKAFDPPADVVNSPNHANFLIHVEDGNGILNSVVLWMCPGATCPAPGDAVAVVQETPNTSVFNQTVTFDTSEYDNGWYQFWATATDDEGNLANSVSYDKYVGNYCRIDGLTLERDLSGIMTVSGTLELNENGTDGTVYLTVADGNGIVQSPSVTTSDGTFSWTSSPSAMVAAVDVSATGTHETCIANAVTAAEYCDVTATGSFDYETGRVTVDWQYTLGGSGYVGTADTLFANVTDGSLNDDYNVSNKSNETWTTTTEFGMTNVDVTAGGQYGECYFETPSFVINAPYCEINVTDQYPNDDGSMTVGWKMLLDGADHVANLNAVIHDADNTDSYSIVNAISTTWTTTAQFTNDVTVDLYGEYGVCNASDTFGISPFTCEIVVNNAWINEDGTVFADWSYLLNSTAYDADSMVVITNSIIYPTEPQDKGTFTGVSNGTSTWTSNQQYANNVNVYMYGQFGACNATASQMVNAPTCQINTSSSRNDDGTITYTWSYLMNGSTHDADTMTIVTNSVSDPADGAAFNNVLVIDQPKSWTTSVPYTNTVTADLTGQFGVCNATDTLVVTPPAPTCNVDITSGPTYDITDGTVTVGWQFVLYDAPYIANALIVNANSGIAGEYAEQTYSNHIGSYSWTTPLATPFTNDVTLEFSGSYSDTCSFVNAIDVPVPACEVEFIGSPSYNVLDGTVTTDWRFLKDTAVAYADVLNAVAHNGIEADEVYSVANANVTTWNTNTTTWSSDVTVDIGGNEGVCVAPTQSQSVHVDTCQVNITSVPIYNVMDGHVTVDWEYRLEGALQNATLDASASDLDGNADNTFTPVVANSTQWITTGAAFTNDVTVDVSGQYGVCNATDTQTVVVPQCELSVTAGANTDGTVTVDWEFLRGGAPQAAELVSITTESLSDPTDGTTFGGINGTSWTSSNRYTSDVTVTVDGNYGVCEAPTVTTSVTPPAPWCDSIITSGPTYDITNGTVSVGWDFRLNGLPYVANTMTAVANGVAVGETDNQTFTEQQTFSWTSSDLKPFTDDVTIYLTGAYSDTCSMTNTVTLDVPACTVNITGSSYDYSDGSVTTDWEFLIDGVKQDADILNAVAHNGVDPAESTLVALVNSTSWTTLTQANTAPWTNDVTVDVGGNRGVCVAPAESVDINVPVCEVEITGSTYNFSDGTVTADWKFLIDGVEQQADVLNAVASDVPAGGSTTEAVNPVATNANSVSWTTLTTDWPNDVTVDVGGNKGVCMASAQSTTITRPVCTVEITNTSYNLMTDGSVTADWRFMINGVDAQAEVLNAVASDVPAGGSTTEAVNPVAINVNSTSWTTGTTDWPNNVTVDVGGNYGVCVAPAVSNTVHVNTCQAVINSTAYDVSDGSVTVEWSYYLDGVLQDATLDASASDLDGNTDNSFAPVVANNTQWITTTAFTNDVTVDVSGQYGVCNATDTQTVVVPQCELSVTANDNPNGTVTVDWEFLRGGTPQAADNVSITTDSLSDPADGTTGSGLSGSWTSSVVYTNTVTVTVDGDYGVCVAPTVTNTITPPVPSCNVTVVSGPSYDIDSGQVSVDWQFLLNDSLYNADTITAAADSDIGEYDEQIYNNYIGTYTWTTAAPSGFTNDVTLTFSGSYSDTCSFTNSSIVVDVPSCEVTIDSYSYNFTDGSVTTSWSFLMDGVANAADVLNAVASDVPAGGSTTETVNPFDTNVDNTSWTTSTTDWPGDVTVYVGGNNGKCVAPTQSTMITIPTCDVEFVSSPSYNVLDGTVTADWRFMINGVDAQAEILNAVASNGVEPDETMAPPAANVNSTSWTTGTADWSSDVTVYIGGNKGVCVAPAQNQSVHVPTCAVEFVSGPTYELSDGSVTAEWRFLMDGVVNTAEVLNAVATDGVTTEDVNPVDTNVSSTIWNTTTKPWPNDVTVEIGGNKGVCVAPPVSAIANKPECWVEFTYGPLAILNGAADMSWRFMVDGAEHEAQVLNATADDGYSSDFYSTTNTSSTSWTTGVAFTNDIIVDIGAEYGVCQVTNSETVDVTLLADSCVVNITSAIYNNTDGNVDVAWQYELFGNVYPADIMNANAWNIGNPTAENAGIEDYDIATYAWDTSTALSNGLFSDDVTVDIQATYGACAASNTVALTRPICNSIGGYFTDGSYSTQATYYDPPLENVGPTYIDGAMYIQIDDCDENENRYAVDTVTADLSSDNSGTMADDSLAGVVLTETGNNTGIFRGEPILTRRNEANTLQVKQGSIINGTYTDDDDPADTGTGSIPVSGCREMRYTDALDNDISLVQPDQYPYDPAYPDGASAFHVIVNSPRYAGNGSSGEIVPMRTNSCYFNPSLPGIAVDDNHSVNLVESGDTGIFTIDAGAYTRDYIYVGSDFGNVPAPGGFTDIGLRVAWDQFDGMYALFPDNGVECDPSNNNYYRNFACTEPIGAEELCLRDLGTLSSGGTLSHSAQYGGDCTSDYSATSGNNARDYTFTLTDTTYVKIEMTAPGPLGIGAINAVLFINSGGPAIETDDNSKNPGLSTDARILRWLPAGDYQIEATTAMPSMWGDFTVTLTDQETACPLTAIALGDTVSDVTSPECGLTQYFGPSGELYTRHYELTLGAATDVMFAATGSGASPMPNPYILVYDKADMSLVWEGDNSFVITAPPLPAGTYIIEVMDGVWMNTVYGFDLSVFTPVTQVLPAGLTNSGWYEGATYTRSGSENYLAGWYFSGTSKEYRNFFIFDLSGVTGTIMEATLSVDKANYSIPPIPGTETWTIFDVSTPILTLRSGGGMAAFNDLGSGTSYGSVSIPNAPTPDPVTVNLNASAVSALNGAIGGEIALGGAITTIGFGPDEYIFGGTTSANSRTLTLIIRP